MEESKYYTPKIEEFYVGFEYMVLGLRGPKMELDSEERVFKLSDYQSIESFTTLVKYLDKSDVESLGWEQSKIIPYKGYYEYKKSRLIVYGEFEGVYDRDEDMRRKIHLFNVTPLVSDECYKESKVELFYGVVKNKSELKKIMQQLNIQ